MESDKQIPVTSPTPTINTKTNWAQIIICIIFIFVSLVIIGLLLYQNFQLRNDLVEQKQQFTYNSPSPFPTVFISPVVKANQGIMDNWELYTSKDTGLEFTIPRGTIVREPQLDASLTIENPNNKLVNSELTEGWIVGITYGPVIDTPEVFDPKARAIANATDERQITKCTVSEVTPKKIGNKQGYYFYSINCPKQYDANYYFVKSDTTYYQIQAAYKGNTEEYKRIIDQIITSINFINSP